jgi:hypothetical protein
VSTTEELLVRKSSGSDLENRDYSLTDPQRWPRWHPSIRKRWHQLRRQTARGLQPRSYYYGRDDKWALLQRLVSGQGFFASCCRHNGSISPHDTTYVPAKRLNHLCSQLYLTVFLLYTCHITCFGYIL